MNHSLIDNIQIPDYIRNECKPKQELIKRGYKAKAQPGISELVSTVAGLQKDVKRINACLTKQGADEYIAKNNKHGL